MGNLEHYDEFSEISREQIEFLKTRESYFDNIIYHFSSIDLEPYYDKYAAAKQSDRPSETC